MSETPDNPQDEEAVRAEAKERAEQCSREIQDVLGKYQCRIVPMLTSEPVGSGPGAKALMGATYGILPEVID